MSFVKVRKNGKKSPTKKFKIFGNKKVKIKSELVSPWIAEKDTFSEKYNVIPQDCHPPRHNKEEGTASHQAGSPPSASSAKYHAMFAWVRFLHAILTVNENFLKQEGQLKEKNILNVFLYSFYPKIVPY
jgi:hypothetical protein